MIFSYAPYRPGYGYGYRWRSCVDVALPSESLTIRGRSVGSLGSPVQAASALARGSPGKLPYEPMTHSETHTRQVRIVCLTLIILFYNYLRLSFQAPALLICLGTNG